MFKTIIILYALNFWVIEVHAKSRSVIPALAGAHGFQAFGKSAIGSTYGIETGGGCQKAGSCCLFFLASFFSRVAVLNPSPTLPHRKLASSQGQTASQRSTGRRGGKA